MGELAIRIRSLGKSFQLTPAQIGKKYKKRRVLTEDLSRLIGRRVDPLKASTFWALRDISFDVQQGDVLGIMGPNGAGKTTLLKLLSKITYPTHGEVDIWGRTGALLEVGTGFHSELTGRENIYLSGSIMGMTRPEIDAKFDEIVDFSGVEEFLEMPVKRYSSGMEMRLAFSVAAHLEAEILFIDEVLAVGDSAFRQKCINKIESITANEGRTILFVSHNLKAIRDLCSQAIVLEKGRLASPPTSVPAALEVYQKIMAENVGHSLAERQDRSGLGGLRLVDFSAHNRNGDQIKQVTLGQPVELRIRFRRHDLSIEFGSVAIELAQPDGHLLAALESQEFQIDGEDTGMIACRVNDLPITPGVIQINLKLEGNRQIQDKLTHAGYLIIEGNHPGENGEAADFPMIKIDQEWKLG